VMVRWARAGWNCGTTSEEFHNCKVIAQARRRLHHVSYAFRICPSRLERLKKDGVRLVSREIKTGAGGHKIRVRTSAIRRVLLELVQNN